MTQKNNLVFVFSFAAISTVCYFLFGSKNVESDIDRKYVSNRETSVYLKDGIYRIDSNVITSDKNKLKLYDELSKNNLKESFAVNDIPEFVREFLKEKSYNNHFHVADKCGKWMETGTQPLVMKEIKKYDELKKDSVLELKLVNMDLPEKELNFFGLGENTAVLALKHGGKKQCEEVLIFKFKDNQIVDFWFNIKRKPSLNFGEVLEFIKKNKERSNGSC